MNSKKISQIYFLLSAFLIFVPVHSAFAVLSCTVANVCNAPDVIIMNFSATSNAHAELPSENNYTEFLCCGGVTGLDNTCVDDFDVVLRLSSDTNAHVEENTENTAVYDGHDACMSVPDGTVTVGYQDNSCAGFDETVASISGTPTNAHVGEDTEYTRKVCATVTVAAVVAPGGGGGRPLNPLTNCRVGDFNCDGFVDILDLSILLYYSNQTGSSIEPYDLSDDDDIDLADISILFYYWDVER